MLFQQRVVALIFIFASILLQASSMFQERVCETQLAANTAQVMSGASAGPDNLHKGIEFQQAVTAAQVTSGTSTGQGNSYNGIESQQAVNTAQAEDGVTSDLSYLPNSAESHLRADPVQVNVLSIGQDDARHSTESQPPVTASQAIDRVSSDVNASIDNLHQSAKPQLQANAVEVDRLAETKQDEQAATPDLQNGPANGAPEDPVEHQKSTDPAAIAEISSQPWPPSDPRYHNNSGTAEPKGTAIPKAAKATTAIPNPAKATTAIPKLAKATTAIPGCNEQLNGEKGADYRGCQDHSKTGRQCQKWSSQSPQHHQNTAENKPQAGLINNFCRNPDGEASIWCYTTDPHRRWEECDPKGAPESVACNKELKGPYGADYRGCQHKTKNQKECQQWSSQTPHKHTRTPEYYTASDLVKNYCRNPDGHPTIWCYTTDSHVRWENCV